MNSGFTLVELVVVMALMGIIIGFALPRFHQMTDSDPTDDLVKWIRFKALALREKAQIQQSPWALVIDFSAGEIRTEPAEAPPDDAESSEQTPEPKIERRPMAEGVRIVDVVLAPDKKQSTGEVSIRFYPDGYADPAFIHVRDGEGLYRSLKIEPFLPRVRQFDDYISFEDS